MMVTFQAFQGKNLRICCENMKNWFKLHFRESLAACFGVFLFLLVLVLPASGLRCYQCGQYTDGPGSITPCINYTDAFHLKECPSEASKQCVKYVNEASTVRDCADECNEKRSDSWGTSIYCCSEDGCNSAKSRRLAMFASAFASTVLVWNHLRLSA